MDPWKDLMVFIIGETFFAFKHVFELIFLESLARTIEIQQEAIDELK